MIRPYCGACGHEMDIEEVGTLVVTTYIRNTRLYQVRSTDVYMCRGCGTKVAIAADIASVPIRREMVVEILNRMTGRDSGSVLISPERGYRRPTDDDVVEMLRALIKSVKPI